MKVQLFLLQVSLLVQSVLSEVFTGTISIGCTDGVCTISGDCDPSLTVPGDDQGDGSYSNIDGEVRLSPSTCQADCTSGCIVIPGSDLDDNKCIGSAGYVHCPELEDCVQPWSTNCPFDGDRLVGPTEIVCFEGARCNALTKDCLIEIGSASIGGPYLTDLEGTFTLPEGCAATCEGCTCNGCIDEDYTPPPTALPTKSPTVDDSSAESTKLSFSPVLVALGLGTLLEAMLL